MMIRETSVILAVLCITAFTLLAFASKASAVGPFRQETVFNPISDLVGKGDASPFAIDLDGDNDLDVVVGWGEPASPPYSGGGVSYYKNLGTPSFPDLQDQSGVDNPFGGITRTAELRPALADLNDDDKPDLILGFGNQLLYFENTGATIDAPAFTERTGAANPFTGVLPGEVLSASPSVVDADSDGDFDVFVGQDAQIIYFLENTGTVSAPVFALRTGAANPFNDLTAGSPPHGVAWALIDTDDDYDPLVGTFLGAMRYFDNTGNATDMVLNEVTLGSPFDSVAQPKGNAKPAFGDFDSDTDLDLLVGYQDGAILFFENEDVPSSRIRIDSVTVAENMPAGTLVGNLSHDDWTNLSWSFYAEGCGADNGSFNLVDNQLVTARRFNYEREPRMEIQVQANNGTATAERCIAIAVIDVPDFDVFPSVADALLLKPAPQATVNPVMPGVLFMLLLNE